MGEVILGKNPNKLFQYFKQFSCSLGADLGLFGMELIQFQIKVTPLELVGSHGTEKLWGLGIQSSLYIF